MNIPTALLPARGQRTPDPGWVLTIPAGAAHARLDGAAAEQRRPHLVADAGLVPPSIAADRRYTVVLDGILWNGEELAAGGVAETTADAAVTMLHAYRRWGVGVLARLRGAYALVIYDADEGTFLCARDHAGLHPLFYAEAGDDLLVSSSTEALLRHEGVSPAPARVALAEHVALGYLQIPFETHFAAISRVPPGHVLHDGAEGRRVYRYWDPAPPGATIEWASEDELERLDELLGQAVDRCLRLGPAGVYLSGGIDSATVAVVAADRSRRLGLQAPVALSVVFPDVTCNEEAVQRAVGTDLELPHLLASFDDAVGRGRLLARSLELSARSPVPLLNPFEPAFDHLGAQGRELGCRVLLGGGGGDEWVGLDPLYAADLARRFDVWGLYRVWEAKRRYLPLSALAVLRNNVWRVGVRRFLRDVARTRAPSLSSVYRRRRSSDRIPGWIAPDAELCQELRARAEEDEAPLGSDSRYLEAKRRTLDHPIEALVAEEAFAAGRRLGLRRLEPFWDPDVVDLLYRTPPERLIPGRREKGLARQLVARRLPSIGREWPKTVFVDSFATSVVRGQGPAAWRGLEGASALAELGVVDRDAVREFVERYFAGDATRPGATWDVWNILSVETWLRPRL